MPYAIKSFTRGRLYHCWYSLMRRCYDKKNPSYFRYGGRGITVSNRWLDFENFFKDMKDSYKQGLTLDRIDNDKGYSKKNCRWATHKQQSNNTRRNHFITWHGITKTVTEWSQELGIKIGALKSRIRRGLPLEKCFKMGRLYSPSSTQFRKGHQSWLKGRKGYHNSGSFRAGHPRFIHEGRII